MNAHIEKIRAFIADRKSGFDLGVTRQTAVWKAEAPDSQPLLLSCPADKQWLDSIPNYNTKEAHFDTEKMVTCGFKSMLSVANGGREAVPSIRANMGCGIFPTLFGLTQMLFDDKMPWLQEHLDKKTILHMGPEDLKPGDEFKAGIEHMAKMKELLEDTGAYVFPLDLQSPFGTAHLVYGDTLFYDLYDDPPFVHHLMELSRECLILGLTECMKVMNGSDRLIAHYNNLIIPREMGGLKVSEDTATLVSKDTLDEFVFPYLKGLLGHFGGGYVHYCGKNDYLFDALLKDPLVHGLNFGNPEKHDMEAILKSIAQAEKIYYGGINMLQEESHYDFFLRVLTASQRGELFKLLLQTSAPDEAKRDEMISDWEKAQKILLHG
jgi:hypothetical protein